MSSNDTIAAISTAPGRAGIGVVRVSGSAVLDIANALTGLKPEPGRFSFTSFFTREHELIDSGLLLYFQSPRSYTGEDVIELHVHGSDVVLRNLLNEVCSLGARMARPGEFTERAFVNDKMDLLQAEAVMDLIESTSGKAARSALRSLEGVFSEQITGIQKVLINARALIEAALDFPDEEDIQIDIQPVRDNLVEAMALTASLLKNAEAGAKLNKGLHVVIIGKPNVGKSSLLNRLSGNDVAIVSDTPGTTRDRVLQSILLDGVELQLVDTAGIRESQDEVERLGIERSHDSLQKADLVLYVFDNDADQHALVDLLPQKTPYLLVRNKVDLSSPENCKRQQVLHVSAKTGDGMDNLTGEISRFLKLDSSDENTVSARQRHINAIQTSSNCIENALEGLDTDIGYEVVGELIRQALLSFDEVLGRVSADDILGVIFSKFCIGK